MPLPLHVGPGKLEGVGVLLDADEVPEGRGEETPEEADSAVEVGGSVPREARDRVGHEGVEDVEVALEEVPDVETDPLAGDGHLDEAFPALDPDFIAIAEKEESALAPDMGHQVVETESVTRAGLDPVPDRTQGDLAGGHRDDI